jgi:hypothetical protein
MKNSRPSSQFTWVGLALAMRPVHGSGVETASRHTAAVRRQMLAPSAGHALGHPFAARWAACDHGSWLIATKCKLPAGLRSGNRLGRAFVRFVTERGP